MFHRQTQTERFWEEDFTVNAGDLDDVNNRLLEAERPLPIRDLTLAVMQRRVSQENNKLKRFLSMGTIYQPSKTFAIDEKLVFPALNFLVGSVLGVRDGSNPEAGLFNVINVRFEKTGKTREFAAGLEVLHELNNETEALLRSEESLLTVQQLYERYGRSVQRKLELALKEHPDLVELFALWFLKALLTEIGAGYLNIAEAILDVSGGGPMKPGDLLKDLGLPDESKHELQEFSLNYALYQDERFDEVGPAGQVLWYLRRLEPAKVLYPSKRLEYKPVSYDRGLLNLNLRKLETELDDEWSMGWEPSDHVDEASFTLTYPHWRLGTLPLSSSISPLFPVSYEAPRIRCVLIDSHTDEEIEVWVVWKDRFVFGLVDWYQKNNLPMGAYIHLAPGPEPGSAIIRYETHRSQREWIRVAQVQGDQLRFGMQKRAVSCVYDDMMLIGMDEPESTDDLWMRFSEQGLSLAQVIVRLFPDLARLSPQSTVHAKTLYSAVNMVYRCPPGPIFAELVRQPCFVSMGENYWRYNPSLWTGGEA